MKMAFSAAFQEAICSVSDSSTRSSTRPASSRPRLAARVSNTQHAITSTFIYLNTGRPTRSPDRKSLPSAPSHRTDALQNRHAALGRRWRGMAAEAEHVSPLCLGTVEPKSNPSYAGQVFRRWTSDRPHVSPRAPLRPRPRGSSGGASSVTLSLCPPRFALPLCPQATARTAATAHTWIRSRPSGILTTVVLNTALLFARSEVNVFIHPTSISRAPTACRVRCEALGTPSTCDDRAALTPGGVPDAARPAPPPSRTTKRS